MSQNLYLEQEKLNTFTRTDITVIALSPPILPQVGVASNTQMSGGAEVDMGDDASVVRRRGRAMGPGAFLLQLLQGAAKEQEQVTSPNHSVKNH